MNADTPETDAIEYRLMQDAIEHIQGREALVFEFGGFTRNLERQRNEALQLARELCDALGELVAGVDGWVDDVNNDSSWDGWDSNFKHYAHGGLDCYRKTLTKATKLLP